MANEGTAPNYKYDVYISCRREDTQSIACSLFHALLHRGFIVYVTDDDLSEEEDFSSSLRRVIEESRISIVIFSENYLTCTSLQELEIISACNKVKTQLVYPIFYNVDQDDVCNQKGSYESARTDLEHRFGTEMVENAIEVAYLRGWVFRLDENWNQDEFIQNIVKEITKMYRINRSFSSYDVFLSFSEKDTRYSFTDFLYNVLQREGFRIFRDDEKWEVENQISSTFRMEAIIEESKVSIIVFSENYANSSRRLDALVKILDCNHQRVLPIFYKVRPSDVRYQASHYSKAMDTHESRLGKESEEVKKWRDTLFAIANFSGWHFETGYEYKTMQKVVAMVKKSLPRYDVFISFRGIDTRHTFTGYLYYVLCKKGLKTFIDDMDLEGGDQIPNTLTNVIKESRFSIIVFSENYAFSSWCLDELVTILHWKTTKYPRVWPIYYKVEPSDVWDQKNCYDKAMAKHENRWGKDTERVQKWRSALTQVSQLEKKWHFKTGGYEFEFIENIVEKISNVYSRVYA